MLCESYNTYVKLEDRLILPASVMLNGRKIDLLLSEADSSHAEYRSGKALLRFDYDKDCARVSFTVDFGEETPIYEMKMFAGGVMLQGFDRAFTVQPRNNAGKNMDYFDHLPDISSNGYFCPPLLNMLIGSPEGYVGFGLLDIPDSKQVRMESDRSLLLESAGGNKKTAVYHAPEILITFPTDEWDGIRLFREKLIEFGRYTPKKPKLSEVPAWWKNPIICTYGDQLLEDRVGQNIDDGWVSDFVERAENEWGISKMNLVIDDSWQPSHSFEPVCDETRFPDMRDFCDRMHRRGHHVILWTTPLFDKITNGFVTKAQKLSVLSDFLYKTAYFKDFPGCYAIDYTADAARQFLRQFCEKMFGAGSGQWNADGVKLDFMGQLRDPAETAAYAHPERGVGMREMYLFLKMFSEEARRVKPDVMLDCSVGDPRFEDFITHNRMHDTHAGVEEKEMRVRISSLACPDLLIDSDGALMYTHWLRNHYISAAVYSVPSNYYIKKYHDGASFNDHMLYTAEEAEHKTLLAREKLWYGRLFSLSECRPNGHPVMDSFGNWRLVDENGKTNAVSVRGDTVIYYPTSENDTGYLFTFLDEAQLLPLYGHKFSDLKPKAERDQLIIDYARDRVLLRIRPGEIYTFRNRETGDSLDRLFQSGADMKETESTMNYVNK